MKKITFTLAVSGLLFLTGVKAQTIQEGMNHLYAERYKTAISVFEKMLAVNPNNIEATYWLGQAYLEMDEPASARLAAAKNLYEKALQTSANAPLLMVGMGHVKLLENKINDARQLFETAISMTKTRKGDDPDILTAIGRANIDAKTGNYNYAIQMLETAVARDPKNTEALLQLGNAYRKARPGEGGSEVYKTYQKALEVNPNFAAASLRLAQLFESQKNYEFVLQYLNEAAAKDPKFTPAFFELFYYYFNRGKFPEAEVQLKKYIESKLPESDPQDQFLYAQLCWVQKDFGCAVTKAESVVAAMGENTKPRVYRLLADTYFQKGDYSNAKKNSDRFFAKTGNEDFASNDYKLRADILSKTGGTPDEIFNTYMEEAAMDTVLTSKIDFLKKGAESFKTMGDSVSRNREGDLRLAIIKLRPTSSQRDYFDAGFAYYQGKNYDKSDSLFAAYTLKYPDEPYGWQMRFQIGRIIDSTMEKGIAVPFGLKYLEVLEKDTAKNKNTILTTAAYLAQYYTNIAKDKLKAIEFFKKMLILTPENEDIKKYIDLLEKLSAPRSETTPKNSASAKPAVSKSSSVVKPPKKGVAKNAVAKQ